MNDPIDKPYHVGFGKPPRATQFRKGQSGNPKGRPRGKPNLATVIRRSLAAKVVINEHGQRREVTKLEAGMIQLTNKAAAGDLRALSMLTTLARLAEEHETQKLSNRAEFAEADQKVLPKLMERFEATEGEEEENDND